MPLFGPPDVEKLKAKGDVKGLAKAARHDDLWVRKEAVEALAAIGDTGAIDVLIAALADDWMVATAAAKALGELGDSQAVEPLVLGLKGRPVLHKEATSALKALNDPQAVTLLAAVLGNSREDMKARQASAIALGELGDPRGFESLVAAYEDRGGTSELQERVQVVANNTPLDLLAEQPGATAEGHERIQRALVRAVDEHGDPRALDDLISGPEADVLLRAVAAMALGKIGDGRAVKVLVGALRDDEPAVRAAAAGALGGIGDASAVAPLVAVLRDREGARGSTFEALAHMENESPDIWEVLSAEADAKVQVARANAAFALGAIGEQGAPQALIDAFDDDAALVRLAAASAAQTLGDDRGVKLLVASLGQGTGLEEAAATLLGRAGDRHAVDPLISALSDPDAGVRKAAARALGELGDTRANTALKGALTDDDRSVQMDAALALGKLGDKEAVSRFLASR